MNHHRELGMAQAMLWGWLLHVVYGQFFPAGKVDWMVPILGIVIFGVIRLAARSWSP